MANMHQLDLSTNEMTGTLPESLCELKELVYLNLFINNFEGVVPSCLGGLPKLEWLQLSFNELTGTLNEAMCETNLLVILNLHENRIAGAIPDCLGDMVNLQQLDLSTNEMTGTLSSLCELKQLVYLNLYDNHFEGVVPACWGTAFPSLETMLLHDNLLRGPLPEAWNLPSLVSIVLSNNVGLDGTLPSSLFSQQHAAASPTSGTSSHQLNHNLRAVVIEGTHVHGTIPQALCSALELQTLAVSGNGLTGSLPECFTTLKTLKTLRAAHNHVVGTLPGTVGNLSAMTTMDLSNNGITGYVPSELGEMAPHLASMSLEQNDLSCDLPPSVRHWKRTLNTSDDDPSSQGELVWVWRRQCPGLDHAGSGGTPPRQQTRCGHVQLRGR